MRTSRSLRALLAGFEVPVPDIAVAGVETDSRRVSSGDLFLACRGRGTHGLAHLDQAVERGASAVVWEPAPGWSAPDTAIPEVALPNLTAHVGEIAARCFGRPSERMYCVGVTGTDGKTSTAYLLAQALDRLHLPCAYIGTIGIGRVGELHAATHTTPDPVSLQRCLAHLRDEGAVALAMEVSSHALDQARVASMHFDVAVLTNITRDHLDYHGTVESYAAAKRRLFERDELSARVLNRDDAYGADWAETFSGKPETIVYGLDGDVPADQAYVIGRELTLTPQGLALTLDTSWGQARLDSRLLGRFNAYNLMAVAAVLLSRGIALEAVADALGRSHTVPGRIEGFRGAQAPALVVVDYAHTPDALRQILTAVRAHTPGHLICVFGCGGDRDRGKRPLMGLAATELADVVIVTDDNPRNERPQDIAAEIVAGMPDAARSAVRVIHNRAEAIETALQEAGARDVVVVAGKGHERTQTYGSDVRPFSDRSFVAGLVGAQDMEARA